MYSVSVAKKPINAEALDSAIHGAVTSAYVGHSTTPEAAYLHFDTAATEAQQITALAIYAAHNPASLTPNQQLVSAAQAVQGEAKPTIQNVPGWATWNAASASAWISANVTDLNTAKIVLTRLAMLTVALRDQVFPELRASGG